MTDKCVECGGKLDSGYKYCSTHCRNEHKLKKKLNHLAEKHDIILDDMTYRMIKQAYIELSHYMSRHGVEMTAELVRSCYQEDEALFKTITGLLTENMKESLYNHLE